MPRMTQQEFLDFIDATVTNAEPSTMAVEIGGEGKVVVLRWALPGSTERTEKKVLVASQSPVLIKAAHQAYLGWLLNHMAISGYTEPTHWLCIACGETHPIEDTECPELTGGEE